MNYLRAFSPARTGEEKLGLSKYGGAVSMHCLTARAVEEKCALFNCGGAVVCSLV